MCSGGFEPILPSVFARLKTEFEGSIYQRLLPESLLMQEFLQPWYCDQTVDTVLQRLSRGTPKLVGRELISCLLD